MDGIQPKFEVAHPRPKNLDTIGNSSSRSIDPNPAGCCESVRVVYDESNTEVFQARPEVFQTYTIEPELLNGKVHYTSEDGTHAIAKCNNGAWQIQPVSVR